MLLHFARKVGGSVCTVLTALIFGSFVVSILVWMMFGLHVVVKNIWTYKLQNEFFHLFATILILLFLIRVFLPKGNNPFDKDDDFD